MNIFFMVDQIETRMDEAAHPENRHMTRAATREAEKKEAPAWLKQITFILSAIFALSFFVVRILWGHYHYYQFYRVCWQHWKETPAWFNVSLMALIVVAFLLNGTWFVQIILTGLGYIKKPDPNTRPLPKSTEEPIHLPNLPHLPHIDALPELSKLPDLPHVPNLPNLPHLPKVSTIPPLPHLPKIEDITKILPDALTPNSHKSPSKRRSSAKSPSATSPSKSRRSTPGSPKARKTKSK